MKSNMLRAYLVFMCLLAFTLASCGGGGTVVNPGPNPGGEVWTGTAGTSAAADPGLSGIPEVPVEGLAVSNSSGDPIAPLVLLGSQYLQKYHAEVEGDGLHLLSPAEPPADEHPVAWGLYKFSGLTHKLPHWLNIECLPDEFGQSYMVAIADYTAGDWRWFGPVTFPEFQLDMTDLNHHVISALGNMYFIVVCRDGDGALVSKSTLTLRDGGGGGGDDHLLPGSPRHLTATDGVYPDKVVIEWEPGIDADSYKVWRKTGEDGGWDLLGTEVGTQMTDTSVEPGVHYWYKAVSVNGNGESEKSNRDEGWAGESGGGGDLPGAPAEISASDGTYSEKVAVEWSAVDGATGYIVYRYTPGDENGWVEIATEDGTHYLDFAVDLGVHYNYRVAAVNENGAGEPSVDDEGWAGESGGGNPPAAPTELVATDGAYPDKVVVEWNAVDGASGYIVYRQIDGGEWIELGTEIGNRKTDLTAEPGVHYWYKAVAVNEYGHSDPSNHDEGWAAGGSSGEPPAAPAEIFATDGTYPDKVVIEWSAVDGATSYQVWRYTEGHPDGWVQIATEDGTRLEDLAVEPGIHYWYKVHAVNDYGVSDPSNEEEGWAALADGIPPAAPQNLVATDGAYPGKVVIEWTAVDGATTYIVYRRADGGDWAELGTEIGNHMSDLTAEPGVHYWYKAVAVNDYGTSDPSNDDEGWAAL